MNGKLWPNLACFLLCAGTRVFGVNRFSSVGVVSRLLTAGLGVRLVGWARDFGLCERSWLMKLGAYFTFSVHETLHSSSSTVCFFYGARNFSLTFIYSVFLFRSQKISTHLHLQCVSFSEPGTLHSSSFTVCFFSGARNSPLTSIYSVFLFRNQKLSTHLNLQFVSFSEPGTLHSSSSTVCFFSGAQNSPLIFICSVFLFRSQKLSTHLQCFFSGARNFHSPPSTACFFFGARNSPLTSIYSMFLFRSQKLSTHLHLQCFFFGAGNSHFLLQCVSFSEPETLHSPPSTVCFFFGARNSPLTFIYSVFLFRSQKLSAHHLHCVSFSPFHISAGPTLQ